MVYKSIYSNKINNIEFVPDFIAKIVRHYYTT